MFRRELVTRKVFKKTEILIWESGTKDRGYIEVVLNDPLNDKSIVVLYREYRGWKSYSKAMIAAYNSKLSLIDALKGKHS